MPSPLPGAPFNFRPRGLYDALDGGDAPEGACFALANVIPDITTPRVWQSRPAATLLAASGTSGPISVMIQVGNRVYGMSADGSGRDVPVGYDLAAGAALVISRPSGLPNGAFPLTQATTGAWTPPTMEVVGTRILITHPGYDGSTYFFGWIDISGLVLVTIGDTHTNTTLDGLGSTAGVQIGDRVSGTNIPSGTYVVAIASATSLTMSAAATGTTGGGAVTFNGGTAAVPLYGAGNTNKNALPAVPTAVRQLNNRAYFAIMQFAYYSDVLSPCQMNAATQFLTCGDSVSSGNNITGFGQLPLNNQIAGGVVGSLIAFRATNGYYQIKGDLATTDLTLDGPLSSVGCQAPRTIVQTPAGLFFMAADGVRIVAFDGTLVPDPLKAVRQPFVSATIPSRCCAAYNNGVYRIAGFFMYDPVGLNSAFVDYWFHFALQEWSGPHNSGAGNGTSWDGMVGYGDRFVVVSNEISGSWYQSYTFTPASPSYTENGNSYTLRLTTSPLAQGDGMAVKSVIEGTVDLGFPAATPAKSFSLNFFNETTIVQGTLTLTGPTAGCTLQPFSIPFSAPLVYSKIDARIGALCIAGQRIGTIRFRTEELGYMNTTFPT